MAVVRYERYENVVDGSRMIGFPLVIAGYERDWATRLALTTELQDVGQ